MAKKLENKAAETEEINIAAEKQEGKKKKKGRKRRIVKRLIWTLVILLVVGVAVWSIYSKLRAEYKVTYDPYTATTGSISNSLSFTGSMQLIDSATYTASSNCKVKEIYAAVGDKVKEGDRLMRLSGGETIEAEFDGTVSSIEVEKGDEIKAEATLLTVADFDHMIVSVRVGESNITQVSVGQSCKVTVSSVGASFDASIDAIDYATYSGNNVAYYTAKVNVDTSEAQNVWPGMQATVTITLDEAKDVTVMKMEGLSTKRDNTAFVYKENEDGEMEAVTVTVGVSNGNYVEIKDGIAPGETVYKIAEKTEEETGLAALFSGLFSNRQVNRPNNRNRNSQGSDVMPDFSNMPSGFPGGGSGGSGGSGFPGGGSRGN
uniref:RND family efflux transporter MFP subunit n=1 Tax=uncultured bacterium Contig27 TaxID=1393547 RepID=W0FNN3_9BACT|nr:RND family efflux transporter MFP subunit [uncultured bacterium Contig27]